MSDAQETALHERIAELERERDYLLEIDGRAHIRAERAEDRAEKLERRLTAAREAHDSLFEPVGIAGEHGLAWERLRAALADDGPEEG